MRSTFCNTVLTKSKSFIERNISIFFVSCRLLKHKFNFHFFCYVLLTFWYHKAICRKKHLTLVNYLKSDLHSDMTNLRSLYKHYSQRQAENEPSVGNGLPVAWFICPQLQKQQVCVFFVLIFSFFLFLFQVLKDSKSKPIVAFYLNLSFPKIATKLKRGEI